MTVCVPRSSKDQVSKFFLVKAVILVELMSSQPCLSSYHILKTPGHEIIKSWNCTISWTGRDPQGSLMSKSCLHRTAPKITPCAWSIVQTLPELWQTWCCGHCPGGPVPVPGSIWLNVDLQGGSWDPTHRSLLQSVGWEAPASWTQGVISVLKKTPAWFEWTTPYT